MVDQSPRRLPEQGPQGARGWRDLLCRVRAAVGAHRVFHVCPFRRREVVLRNSARVKEVTLGVWQQ